MNCRSITYATGDATRPNLGGPAVIAHVCNDKGAWGRGFVLAISKRWKLPEQEFRAWAARGEPSFGLGEVQFVEVADNVWVANMVAQHGIRSKGGIPPIRYDALQSTLQKVADFCLEYQASVHMPRIGCGLAGGEWSAVAEIVENTLIRNGIPVTVYDLPTSLPSALPLVPPPLTRDELISAMTGGLIPKWCFFWGHTPAKDGSVTKSFFSQWWDGHPFVIEEVTYPTAEHYMMAEKARLFEDGEILSQILSSRHPSEAKKLGRKVRGFDEAVWLEARWDIVVRANLAKFSQHPDLREFLLNTGARILVEASPFDRIWGIGMGASNPDAGEPARWKGLNLLGFALMAIREKLSGSGL